MLSDQSKVSGAHPKARTEKSALLQTCGLHAVLWTGRYVSILGILTSGHPWCPAARLMRGRGAPSIPQEGHAVRGTGQPRTLARGP